MVNEDACSVFNSGYSRCFVRKVFRFSRKSYVQWISIFKRDLTRTLSLETIARSVVDKRTTIMAITSDDGCDLLITIVCNFQIKNLFNFFKFILNFSEHVEYGRWGDNLNVSIDLSSFWPQPTGPNPMFERLKKKKKRKTLAVFSITVKRPNLEKR